MSLRSLVVRRAPVAAGVLALSLVVGCNEADPTPKMPSPSASPTTSEPTQTPTTDPLAIPEAAKNRSLQGAEAAVRHYFDMYNHLIRTGDAKPIKKLYGDRCLICFGLVSVVETAYERGSTVEGLQTLRRAKAYSGAKGYTAVIATYDSTPIEEISPSAERTIRTPGGKKQTFQFNYAYQRGFWELLTIEVPE